MIKKLRIALLKLIFTKEERGFISSGLSSGVERYEDRYNAIDCEAYHSEPLKRNLPKLIELDDLFRKAI